MNPSRFRWGVLFILVGVLLLMNNTGKLAWGAWEDILSLWPILLIAIGIEKIFTKSKAEFISYLSTLALAAIVIWVAWGGGIDGYREHGSSRYRVEMDDDVQKIVGNIKVKNHDLNLNGTDNDLIYARYNGFGRSPRIDYQIENGIGQLNIVDHSHWSWISTSRYSNDLNLYLKQHLPISLTCSGDKSNMRLDCHLLKIEDLSIDSKEGNIRIILGNFSDMVRLSLKGKEADFNLQLPEGCGLRVTGVDKDNERLLERIGLVRSGDVFISNGYDTLKPKIELHLDPNVTQLGIDYR